MDELNKTKGKSLFKDVTEGSKTVVVYVELHDDFGWELAIIGKANYMTRWTEWFPTSREAMDRGLSAILREGIDEFYSNPEFSWLNEL